MLEILGLLADGFTIVFQLQNLLLIIGVSINVLIDYYSLNDTGN